MKSGFIAIVGRPNAGKSTLLNSIMQHKLAIVSSKPQTTRNNIMGILTEEDAQMIFIDTPGIHKPHHQLGRTLNKSAYSSLTDADVIYYVVDASVPFGSGEEFVLNQIKDKSNHIVLILNKVDLLNKEEIMKLILEWNQRYPFQEIFPLSAKEGMNVNELIQTSKNYLSEGPQYFDSETIWDHDNKFMISEIIREKVIYKTEEEIPHSIAVIIENLQEDEHSLYIQALIIVERKSQKGILIGKQGKMISSITQSARKDLKMIFGKRVDLELYVRVEENWRNKESKINQFGIGEIDE